MADLRLPLTDRNIASLPYSLEDWYLVRDVELAGFFVQIGKRSKTFMIQGDRRQGKERASIRMKVACVEEMSTRDARVRAKVLLASIASGEDPRPNRPVAEIAKVGEIPTLRQAWARYKVSHLERKGRSPSTIAHYRDHVERLLAAWLEEPLDKFGDEPALVTARHDEITRDNGPTMANGSMRSFRAIYNHARKTCRKLPAENPTFAIDWNPEVRRDTAMGVGDLPEWFEQVGALENPVRREFHLISLLSGCRPTALKEAKLVDLDLGRRMLRITKPKGGEKMAFDIPLSRRMLESFLRLRRLASILYAEESKIWLFPSETATGHLSEHKEKRTVVSHWGNDLRQSYRTLGQAAGVPELDMHLLMNHSLGGVNPGYITRDKLVADHLRTQQEKLSNFIIKRVVGQGRRPSSTVSRWLNSTSRVHLSDLLSADPDQVRERVGPRSALRRLEVQVARCVAQGLSDAYIDPPSRRLRT
jgi:integrase